MYGTAAYFITTVGWDFLPMRVAPTALFAAVTYSVMGLRPGLGRVASFFGVLVLVNLAGTAMSMAVGDRAMCYLVSRTGALLLQPPFWVIALQAGGEEGPAGG